MGVDVFYYHDPENPWPSGHSITDEQLDERAVYIHTVPLENTSTVVDYLEIGWDGESEYHWIPVIKIRYRDNAGGGTMRSAHWSANGPRVCCGACIFLADVVNLEARYGGKFRGLTAATVIWDTVFEDGIDGFRLERAGQLEGPWPPVGDLVPPRGQGGEGASYAVDDAFRARGAREAFYRVLVIEGVREPQLAGPVPLVIPRGPTRWRASEDKGGGAKPPPVSRSRSAGAASRPASRPSAARR